MQWLLRKSHPLWVSALMLRKERCHWMQRKGKTFFFLFLFVLYLCTSANTPPQAGSFCCCFEQNPSFLWEKETFCPKKKGYFDTKSSYFCHEINLHIWVQQPLEEMICTVIKVFVGVCVSMWSTVAIIFSDTTWIHNISTNVFWIITAEWRSKWQTTFNGHLWVHISLKHILSTAF